MTVRHVARSLSLDAGKGCSIPGVTAHGRIRAHLPVALLVVGIVLGAIDPENRWPQVVARLAWPALRNAAASNGPDLTAIDALAARLAKARGPRLLILEAPPHTEAATALLYRLRRDLDPIPLDAAFVETPGPIIPTAAHTEASDARSTNTRIGQEVTAGGSAVAPAPGTAVTLELIDLDYRHYAGRSIDASTYGTVVTMGEPRKEVLPAGPCVTVRIPGIGPVHLIGVRSHG